MKPADPPLADGTSEIRDDPAGEGVRPATAKPPPPETPDRHGASLRPEAIRQGRTPPGEGSDLARLRGFAPPLANRRDAIFTRALAAADCLAAIAGLLCAVVINQQRFGLASLLTVPAIVLINKLGGRYDRDELVLCKTTLDEAPILSALAAAYALVWSVVTIAFNVHSSRGAVLVLWAGTSGALITLRMVARRIAQRAAPPERALIIGLSGERIQLGQRLTADPSAHVEIVGYLPLEDERGAQNGWNQENRRRRIVSIADLDEIARTGSVDRLIVIPPSHDPDAVFEAVAVAHAVGLKVSIVPKIFQVLGSSVEFDQVGSLTILGIRRPGLSRSSQIIKRAMDVVAASIGMLAVAPVGLVVALAIRIDTPGPVFFRQRRIGRGGREFQMIKFRSMIAAAEEHREALQALNESHGIFKISDDPRVTRTGRWLRRSSLDELPQFINILRGDMSLVGPRPLIPEEDLRVEGRHRDRLQLRPGMTGPWQVLGPQRPPLDEMVNLDYLYAANWSLWSDVKFLLRTAEHVLRGRGR